MRNWLIGVVLALGVVIGSFAQNTAPLELVASLEVDAVRALAMSSDGEQLIVATSSGNEAQVYNLADPSSPRFVNAVQLDGTPTASIGAQGFALVTVAAEDADLLQIIARPPYNPRQGFINYGTYDVISEPARMAISPSSRWGIIYGENGFTALEILSADEINSATREGISVRGAAVSNDALLLLPTDDAVVEVFTMERGAQLGNNRQLELNEAGRDIALNIRGTVGAVVLEDNTLMMFDAVELAEIGTFELPGEYSQVNFFTREDSEWLILSNSENESLLLLDVTDPGAIEPVGAFELDTPLQALTVYNDLLVVSDGQTVSVFAAE